MPKTVKEIRELWEAWNLDKPEIADDYDKYIYIDELELEQLRKELKEKYFDDTFNFSEMDIDDVFAHYGLETAKVQSSKVSGDSIDEVDNPTLRIINEGANPSKPNVFNGNAGYLGSKEVKK